MGFIKQWNRVFRETVKPVNCEQGKLFIRKNLFSLNKRVYCRVWDSEVVSFPLIYQKLCFDPFRSVGAECDQCSFLQQTSWLPLFSALWAFQGALRPLRVHIRAISASKTTAFLTQLLFGLVSCTVKMVCIRAIFSVPWRTGIGSSHSFISLVWQTCVKVLAL